MLLLSELDWPRVLLNRRAAILIGISAALSIGALVTRHFDIRPYMVSPMNLELISISGAVAAIGAWCLLVCMGFFWLRCDNSSKPIKAVWLALLLLGWTYGSHVAYYTIVYLPAVFRILRNPEAEYQTATPLGFDDVCKLIWPLGWALGAAWVLFIVVIGSSFIFPKIEFHESDSSYPFIGDWMVALIVGTPIYLVLLATCFWKRWSKRSSPTDLSVRR